jgi:hypothetical protein
LRESIAVTRAVVRDVERRARARRAAVLFLVVSLGAGGDVEDELVRAVFAEPDVPFARVRVDAPHLLPFDGHPDAEASRALAAVASSALRGQRAALGF